MKGPEPRKLSRLRVMAVVLIVVVLGALVAFVLWYRSGSTNQGEVWQWTEPFDSSIQPGMIDVVSGWLGANGTVLNVTVGVAEPMSVLGDGEWAQWNVTVILENETDTLNVYVVDMQLNSTGLTGFIQPAGSQAAGEQNATACQVTFKSEILTALAPAQELPNATAVEWNVLSTYEKDVGDQVVNSTSDLAPAQGLAQTVLSP